ncbi:hypothetical protein [Mesorhizobium sp. M0138]|uniref:hypothetical protein n=1 Tax=unclassified Mesorhizobium TaxID=325217 RepID=UPI00333DE66D
MAKSEAFVMPDLADVDPEFAKIEQQFVDLNTRKSATERELADIRAELADSRGPVLAPSVSALLGEAPDSVSGQRQHAAELARLVADLGAAIDIVSKRIRDRRDLAKRPLIDTIRTEYQRRAATVADALEAASEPLRALEDLRRDFDAHDVAGHFEWPHSNISHFAGAFIAAARKGGA